MVGRDDEENLRREKERNNEQKERRAPEKEGREIVRSKIVRTQSKTKEEQTTASLMGLKRLPV